MVALEVATRVGWQKAFDASVDFTDAGWVATLWRQCVGPMLHLAVRFDASARS